MTASDIANASSITWANYVDLQNDVLPYIQMPSSDTTRLNQLQLVTDFVCQESQRLLAKAIAPTTFFGRFDGWSGWNGSVVLLPYYPVLSITECIEWWGTNGPNYLTEQTPSNQVDGFNLEAATGMLTRVFPGLVQRPWFPGSRSIEVTWTAGYNPIPALYKIPALELIAEWWRETQQASRSGPSPAGMSMLSAETGTYPGISRRVQAVYLSSAQVGIG